MTARILIKFCYVMPSVDIVASCEPWYHKCIDPFEKANALIRYRSPYRARWVFGSPVSNFITRPNERLSFKQRPNWVYFNFARIRITSNLFCTLCHIVGTHSKTHNKTAVLSCLYSQDSIAFIFCNLVFLFSVKRDWLDSLYPAERAAMHSLNIKMKLPIQITTLWWFI